MGQIKNIKLHIVTDIKVPKWGGRMREKRRRGQTAAARRKILLGNGSLLEMHQMKTAARTKEQRKEKHTAMVEVNHETIKMPSPKTVKMTTITTTTMTMMTKDLL